MAQGGQGGKPHPRPDPPPPPPPDVREPHNGTPLLGEEARPTSGGRCREEGRVGVRNKDAHRSKKKEEKEEGGGQGGRGASAPRDTMATRRATPGRPPTARSPADVSEDERVLPAGKVSAAWSSLTPFPATPSACKRRRGRYK